MKPNQYSALEETDRVRAHTQDEINDRIDRRIQENIHYFSIQSPDVISKRIDELDREWDIERLLETNASAIALTGVILGITVDRKWLLLPTAVLSFLLMHAIQGWCPPVPLLRRLGVRTQREIDEEKYALKYFRGDFAEARSVLENARQAIAVYRAVAS